MYSINMKKFQNTPRGEKGKATAGAKRTRLPDSFFKDEYTTASGAKRILRLHPTKGVRDEHA